MRWSFGGNTVSGVYFPSSMPEECVTRIRNIVSFPASIAACCIVAPGVLLQHVINMLHAGDLPLADAIHALVQPADRRPERNAVMPDLPLRLQPLQRPPDRVVIHLLHADVMQLQQIDPIRLQPREGRVRGAHQRLRRKILRDLALPPAALVAVLHEVVADLGRDHDLVRWFVGKALARYSSLSPLP